jgi:hypothetical protein
MNRISFCLFMLVGCLGAVEPLEEAIQNLSAPSFSERELATRFLIQYRGEGIDLRLKTLRASDDPEIAMRAELVLQYRRFGLRLDTPKVLLDAVQTLRTSKNPKDRLALLEEITKTAKPGEIHLMPLYLEAGRQAEDAELLGIIELAGALFESKLTVQPEEFEQMAELIKRVPGDKQIELARRYGAPGIIAELINAAPARRRANLYDDWYSALSIRHPKGDAAAYNELWKLLAAEPELVRNHLAQSMAVPPLTFDFYAGDFDIAIDKRTELIEYMTIPQKSWNKSVDRLSGADELARVMLMWGDESQVVRILERGIDAEDEYSMRGFVSAAFLLGELDHWSKIYEARLNDDRSDRNRRVTALLRKASDHYDDAWALLEAKDNHLRIYEQLAIETGHWSEAYDALIEHKKELGFGEERQNTQYHLAALYLAQHAGRRDDYPQHLEVVSQANNRDPKRHIQRLLINRRTTLAIQVAKAYGRHEDVFEIHTLLHDYDGAFRFAKDLLRVQEAPELQRLAVDYFNQRAPEKAKALKEIRPMCAQRNRPLGPFDETVLCVLKPEKVRQAEGDQLALAEEKLQAWAKKRYSFHKLFESGQHLVMSGDAAQSAEGHRRMRIAAVMPLAHRWAGRTSTYGPKKLIAPRDQVVKFVGGGTDTGFTGLQRKGFHPLRKAGRPRDAALRWASGHYHMLRMDGGILYGKYLWALNNGMHTQEGLGLQALKEGRLEDSHHHLNESWRLSIEPTWLGSALVKHYQEAADEAAALKVFKQFQHQLNGYAAQLPGDKRFAKKLAEWREVTGYP